MRIRSTFHGGRCQGCFRRRTRDVCGRGEKRRLRSACAPERDGKKKASLRVFLAWRRREIRRSIVQAGANQTVKRSSSKTKPPPDFSSGGRLTIATLLLAAALLHHAADTAAAAISRRRRGGCADERQ